MGPVCFVLQRQLRCNRPWTCSQWGSSTTRYCSDRICTGQGLKEIFKYLAWDFGFNLWSLQLTALVSEYLSILRASKIEIISFSQEAKLPVSSWFFFFNKETGFSSETSQGHQLRAHTFCTSTCCASASWPREFFELSEKAAPSSCEHEKDNH